MPGDEEVFKQKLGGGVILGSSESLLGKVRAASLYRSNPEMKPPHI